MHRISFIKFFFLDFFVLFVPVSRLVWILAKRAYWRVASIQLSICFSACISEVPTRPFCVKFPIGDFSENVSRNSNLIKIGQYLHEGW